MPQEPFDGQRDDGMDCQLLTIKQLAQQARVSVETIRRRVRDGKIPYYQPGGPGTAMRFPSDAFERGSGPLPPERDSLGNANSTDRDAPRVAPLNHSEPAPTRDRRRRGRPLSWAEHTGE